MASPPNLFLWPPHTSSYSPSTFQDCSTHIQETPPSKPKPKPKSKLKRSSKSSSSSSKKAPQRGLGVAQLELIRIQERDLDNKFYVDANLNAPFPANLPSIYDVNISAPQVPSPPFCLFPHLHHQPQFRVGYGQAASTIRSALHTQYAMDRVRVGGAGSGGLFNCPELPSNQMPVNQQFGLCACSKTRGFGEGQYYFSMVDEGRFGREREMKEYEFIPNSLNKAGLGDCGEGDGVVAASSGSAAAAAAGSEELDLALKLSSYY